MAIVLESARSKALRDAPLDSWIAFSSDESKVVAVAASYEGVVKLSDDAGEADPVIVKTPKNWHPFSV